MIPPKFTANIQLAFNVLWDSSRTLADRIVYAYGLLLFVPAAVLPRPLAMRFRDIQIMMFGRPIDRVSGLDLDRIMEEATEYQKRQILHALRHFVRDVRETLGIART